MSKKQSLASIKFRNFMKKNAILLTIVILFLAIVGGVIFNSDSSVDDRVYGDDVIEMHYFHLRTCPHCHEQARFHPTLEERFPNLKIIEYEISNAANQAKYAELANSIGGADPVRISTPTTFIGNRANVGYGNDETTGQTLIQMIEEVQNQIDENWDDSTMTRTVDLRSQ